VVARDIGEGRNHGLSDLDEARMAQVFTCEHTYVVD
jgi:hypothetical protein